MGVLDKIKAISLIMEHVLIVSNIFHRLLPVNAIVLAKDSQSKLYNNDAVVPAGSGDEHG